MLFRSFQIIQVLANQNKSVMECLTLKKPDKLPNYVIWSEITKGLTEEKPIRFRARCHNEPKKWHSKNKWFTVSKSPQPPTQDREPGGIMPLRNKLSFVGNLFQKSRNANTLTFKWTYLCKVRFETAKYWSEAILVSKR
jgi:hypothetical protein